MSFSFTSSANFKLFTICFRGPQLECMIEKFGDFDKLMNAFSPFFHQFCLNHLDVLKNLGLSSASVKCACFVEGAGSTELTMYISSDKLK